MVVISREILIPITVVLLLKFTKSHRRHESISVAGMETLKSIEMSQGGGYKSKCFCLVILPVSMN